METDSLNENKLLALSCVRDFFAALDHLETQLSNQEIKVKYRGAMVVGDFEFEVTDHNYNLNSLVYYVASRLSKLSKSKNHNVTLLEKDIEGLEYLTDLTPSQSETLKGLGMHRYCEIAQFHSVDMILKEGQFEKIRFFRSEGDLIKIMNFSISLIAQNRLPELQAIHTQLRGFHLEEFLTSTELPEVYLKLLTVAIKNCDEATSAAITSLAKTLFSANMNNQLIENHFRSAANTQLPRLRANMVEVYNQLTTYKDQVWNQSHFAFENNRVRGNVIIGACQDEINDFYKEKIRQFMLSKEDRTIASGLFVMGHLYRLFYTKNKVYFANDDWFKQVPDEIRRFTSHTSILVKTRADQELAKIVELE
jgi:hypothetical protein